MLSSRKKLLDDLQISYGPHNLLGRFFLKATEMAADRGVTLRFASFDELAAANARNAKSWRPLDTILNPDLSQLDDTTSFCIVGENGDGEVVATQGLRLYDWRGSNLKAEAEALRMFYRDPADAAPGEACRVSAASASRITGLVGYAGGVWYRPDYRGGRLSTILPRVGRTITLARWGVDFVTGMMAEATVAAGFASRSGFASVEWDILRRNAPVSGIPESTLRLALVFMTADEVVDSAFSWMIDTEAEVDRAVGARRA